MPFECNSRCAQNRVDLYLNIVVRGRIFCSLYRAPSENMGFSNRFSRTSLWSTICMQRSYNTYDCNNNFRWGTSRAYTSRAYTSRDEGTILIEMYYMESCSYPDEHSPVVMQFPSVIATK